MAGDNATPVVKPLEIQEAEMTGKPDEVFFVEFPTDESNDLAVLNILEGFTGKFLDVREHDTAALRQAIAEPGKYIIEGSQAWSDCRNGHSPSFVEVRVRRVGDFDKSPSLTIQKMEKATSLADDPLSERREGDDALEMHELEQSIPMHLKAT